MDNYGVGPAVLSLEELVEENKKQREMLVQMAERMCSPPITETQLHLFHAIEILNTIPKRSRYYKHARKAVEVLQNATPPLPRKSSIFDA
jgi:hypothetical protein